jgi:hypothetical protein
MVNYFWLSLDPDQSARWYCDQHCFKIGAEVVESIWTPALLLAPHLAQRAERLGIKKTYMYRRTTKGLWHPLYVWHGLCRANMRRGLINANAIFKEHQARTGKAHVAWKDCKFLLSVIDTIDFNTEVWAKWYITQTDRPERQQWKLDHGFEDHTIVDRNTCDMSQPVQCINEKLFPGCRVKGDVVAAYRRYYHAKIYSIGILRYYHSVPPKWLTGRRVKFGEKVKILPYKLDPEGYVIVVF